MFLFLEVYPLLHTFSFLISDQFIFGVFLLINLLVGLWAGKGVKTLRDYSLGKKDFSTGALTATIVATWISGSFMTFKLAQVYNEGWYFILPFMGNSLALLVTGLWLVPRMGEFLSNLSVAEALGDLYGKTVRIITAICGILVSIGGVAIQFKVSAKVLAVVFGFNELYATLAAASILITYSALGGIRAVTFTDIVQFFTFAAFIPLLALVVWNGIKNPAAALEAIQASPQFDLSAFLHSPKRLASSVALMLFYLVPAFVPTVFQRVSMGNNTQQVKRSFIYSFFLSLAISLFIIWIAILLLGQHAQIGASGPFHYIIETYTYPGLKGLILVGTMSMVMSTADSHLHAAAVLLAHDIMKPLGIGLKNEILMAKLFSFLVGGLALLLALYKTDFLDLVLMAWGFYMPIVTVPLLLAIFGFRSSSRAVLICMGAGFIMVVVWDLFLASTGINSIIPGMVANIVCLMGSHYLLKEKGGWGQIGDKTSLLAARQERREQWRKWIYAIKHPKMYTYIKQHLPAYEMVYFLCGLYVMGATYAAFYTIPPATIAAYHQLYNWITHSVLVTTAVFLTYPAWPPRLKSQRFMAFAWPSGIMYILFMVGTLLVFLSSFHEVQVMIFLLNLVIAALLLPWPLMSVLAAMGMGIGCLVFNLYQGPIQVLRLAGGMQFKLIYGILLISSCLIALFRFKERQSKLETQHGYLLNSYEAIKKELARVLRCREELLQELNPAEIKLFDEITTNYLQQAIYRVRDYMRLEVSEIGMDGLFSEVRTILQVSTLQPAPQLIIDKKTSCNTLQADVEKIKQLLVNSISYLQAHNPGHQPMTIVLEDTRLGYELSHMPGYLKKLAAIRITITAAKQLPSLEEVYTHYT
jgi:Na+/proline symporter